MGEDIEYAGCNGVYDDGKPLDPQMNQNHCKVGQDKAGAAYVASGDNRRVVTTEEEAEAGHIPMSQNCVDMDSMQGVGKVDHAVVGDGGEDTYGEEGLDDAADELPEDHLGHALV